MARYWPMSYQNKLGKLEIPYKGESQRAKLYEFTRFPYTYAHDVPGVKPYPYYLSGVKPVQYGTRDGIPVPYQRSVYGRSISDYGYRAPMTYRSELLRYAHPSYYSELDYIEDYHHRHRPRYSRYHDYWY